MIPIQYVLGPMAAIYIIYQIIQGSIAWAIVAGAALVSAAIWGKR